MSYTIRSEIPQKLNELKETLKSSKEKKVVNQCLKIIKKLTADSCFVEWMIDDVLGTAKDKGIKISKSRARDIIDKMESNHDASLGITWDTIDWFLDN